MVYVGISAETNRELRFDFPLWEKKPTDEEHAKKKDQLEREQCKRRQGNLTELTTYEVRQL